MDVVFNVPSVLLRTVLFKEGSNVCMSYSRIKLNVCKRTNAVVPVILYSKRMDLVVSSKIMCTVSMVAVH